MNAMTHADAPKQICTRCLAKKPSADELHAALCGDYWGAMRSMYRRTGMNWDAVITAFVVSGGAA